MPLASATPVSSRSMTSDRLRQGQRRPDMVGDPAVGLHQIHQVGDPDDVVQVAG
jgi:hypothetical protein